MDDVRRQMQLNQETTEFEYRGRASLSQLAAVLRGQTSPESLQPIVREPAVHQLWAHQLEFDLYEAATAAKNGDSRASNMFASITERAQQWDMRWIANAVVEFKKEYPKSTMATRPSV